MKIDIMSDLHINTHMKHLKPNDNLVERLWNRLDPKAEVLIVAGDIGEINEQNVNFLASLKRLFYREIVCIAGNHDLHTLYNRVIYLWDENRELIEQPSWETYTQRIENAKQLYKDAGIHFLDGEIITIDGKKIGGAMGWYDGVYPAVHKIGLGKHRMFGYRDYEDMQELWGACMPDGDIKPMRRFDGLMKEELAKIDRIVEDCDIMVTHVMPTIKAIHQNPSWKDDPSCGFFSFNGGEHMQRFNGSHWIFGHSHFSAKFRIERENKPPFTLLTNTLGYPSENPRDYPKIATIEV